MKKKLTHSLLTALCFALSLIALTYCDSDSYAKPDEIDTEKAKVERTALSTFVFKYQAFVNTLSSTQQDQLASYINAEEAIAASAKLNVKPECNCPEGSGSCSASGAFSECCTCWNPNTQSGSCNTTLGFASCKVTDNNPPQSKASQAKTEYATVYPKRFSNMLDYLSGIGVDVKTIRSDFANVVKAAQ